MTQFPLGLPTRTALGGEDFFVSPANSDAVGWIDRWPAWPGGVLALCGPLGAGKSHLAAVWQQMSGAEVLRHSALGPDAAMAARRGAALVLEDVDPDGSAGDSAREVALFHLLNTIREVGGSLLLTARRPPGRWTVDLPDLVSRLRALPVAEIAAPDDALIGAVLVKQFGDRQLRVSAEVITYLTHRLERSFASLGAAVEQLDAAALAAQRPITVPFARQVLAL